MMIFKIGVFYLWIKLNFVVINIPKGGLGMKNTENLEKNKNYEETYKEIRIALVVSGGISLAVYIHGVVMELLEFVRAKYDTKDAQNPYLQLLEMLDADVLIDIISGTSAGGINGVLLAKALAEGADFNLEDKRRVADLWIKDADIQQLLRHNGKEAKTLLNGQYMLDKLKEIFNAMSKQVQSHPELAEHRKAGMRALDLFVTTSDIRGQEWHVYDQMGADILGENLVHRFHLRYRTRFQRDEQTTDSTEAAPLKRSYIENDFSPAKDELLAKISRATSAIPCVFPPVEFKRGEFNYLGEKEKVYLYDGGLVDNRPFEPVMKSIYHRSSDKQVNRWLLFVDPNPDKNKDSGREGEPGFLESAQSYTNPLKYQSIYQHLEHISNHNRNAERFDTILSTYEMGNHEQDYRSLLKDNPNLHAYYQLRTEDLKDTLVNKLTQYLKDNNYKNEKALSEFKQELDKIIVINENNVFESVPDVAFYSRFIYYHIKLLNDEIKESEHKKIDKYSIGRRKDILWAALEYLRQIEWLCWNLERAKDLDPESYHMMKKRLGTIALEEALENIKNNKEVETAAKTVIMAMKTTFTLWQEKISTMEKDLVKALQVDGKKPQNFREAVEWYLPKDIFFFPLSIGQWFGQDQIDLIRISSNDANTLGLKGAQKMAGEELGHFSGFFKEEWRSNDIMWGRLDTVDILINYLKQHKNKDSKDYPYWEKQLEHIRVRLFYRILDEELKTMGGNFYNKYSTLKKPPVDADGETNHYIKQLQDFFRNDYKVGEETMKTGAWKFLFSIRNPMRKKKILSRFTRRLFMTLCIHLVKLLIKVWGWLR